jgi:signal transduction histidine kinase
MGAFRTLAALAAYNPPPLDRTDMLQESLVVGGVVAGVFALGFAILSLSNRRKKAAGAAPSGKGHQTPTAGISAVPAEPPGDTPDEDVEVDRELRKRFQDRRIARGTDVDDGILERLSRVAGELDSTRVRIYTDPRAYELQVKESVQTLQGAIRDLRACVVGASSKVVRTAAFSADLEAALAELRAEHGAQFDVQVDENAVALLNATQLDGLLNVAREAVENALRHGRSRIVSLKLRRDDYAVSFVVQDNGRGFAPDLAGTEGKGMALMRAAADAIGGKFEVAARIGNGTRVVVVFQTKRA